LSFCGALASSSGTVGGICFDELHLNCGWLWFKCLKKRKKMVQCPSFLASSQRFFALYSCWHTLCITLVASLNQHWQLTRVMQLLSKAMVVLRQLGVLGLQQIKVEHRRFTFSSKGAHYPVGYQAGRVMSAFFLNF